MDPKQITKEYSNGEVTVVWNASKCKHAGLCVRTNPAVFKPKEKPWIDPTASSTEQIVSAVDQCPSGALTYYKNKE
ncbi:MAG: (4Fe-4S)-binding protein [Bacteroidetes bacterium]|nr:(4Fe-4S)-binding protein [Bacteroidota bacterium]